MSPRGDGQQMPEDRATEWSAWIYVAQRRHGFDLPTARRLTFIRWLCETNRLSGSCGVEDTVAASGDEGAAGGGVPDPAREEGGPWLASPRPTHP